MSFLSSSRKVLGPTNPGRIKKRNPFLRLHRGNLVLPVILAVYFLNNFWWTVRLTPQPAESMITHIIDHGKLSNKSQAIAFDTTAKTELDSTDGGIKQLTKRLAASEEAEATTNATTSEVGRHSASISGKKHRSRTSRDCHEWTGPNKINNDQKQYFCYPDAIVVGPAKSGTTSMWTYTIEHPRMFTHPFGSESRFLTGSDLPTQPLEVQRRRYRGMLTDRRWNTPNRWSYPFTESEANDPTSTLVVEHLPELFTSLRKHSHPKQYVRLVAQLLPKATIVVLLRDPIKRAWSHYLQLAGKNPKWFPGSVKSEIQMLNKCLDDASIDDGHCALTGGHIAYSDYYNESVPVHGGGVGYQSVSTGLYAMILEVWTRYIPKDRICLVDVSSSSRGGEDVPALMQRFEECTGLDPPLTTVEFKTKRHYDKEHVYFDGKMLKQNGTTITDMADSERTKLREFYAPHNQRLCKEWPETCDLDWVKRDLLA